jgi:hypothetical protein
VSNLESDGGARRNENFSDKSDENLSDVPPPRFERGKPVREGLPAGYRMRADARFFDLSWSDRPGGAAAAIGAAAARAVAERHGGDATFVAGAAPGSTVRLTFGLPAEKERRAH